MPHTRLLLRTLFVLALVSFFSTTHAQDAAYRSALKEYMEASGSMKTFSAALDQIIEMQKQTNTSLSEDAWKELRKEMSLSLNDLLDMLAPVYAQHLSIDDLHNVTAFFKSPAGRKLASETPALLQESMEVGGAWGQKIGERIAKKLEERSK